MPSITKFSIGILLLTSLMATSAYSTETPSRASVEQKQVQAIQLINSVGRFANDRFSNDIDKQDAEDAYGGFITRFEAIRSEREALERKEILEDEKTLQNYSASFDRLIGDINKFLK